MNKKNDSISTFTITIGSLLTLSFPVIHYLLFRYLFTEKAINMYGSIKALQKGDGWRSLMICEDLDPVMNILFMVCCVLGIAMSYIAFKKKANKLIVLLPLVSILLILVVQYVIEPNWVAVQVPYNPV